MFMALAQIETNMNFIKRIYDRLFPVSNGKVESPPIPEEFLIIDKVKDLQFRVVTHYDGSNYYKLQHKGRWGWEDVTVLYTYINSELDTLDHPVLSENFEELVEMAKKFKNNPDSFEEHKQRQIDRFNKRAYERKKRNEKHNSKVEYI